MLAVSANNTADIESMTSVDELILESEQEVATARKTLFCPLVWDGLQCWPETAAGQLAVRPCPHYVDNFIIDGLLPLVLLPYFVSDIDVSEAFLRCRLINISETPKLQDFIIHCLCLSL